MDEDFEYSQPYTWDKCSHCNYVFEQHIAVAGQQMPCPLCAITDTLEIYPDPTILRLLDIVGYFDKVATTQATPLPETLVLAIQQETGRKFSGKQLVQLSRQLEALWNRRLQNRASPSIEELVQQTRKALNQVSEEDAQRIWPLAIRYNGTVNEHIASTIIVCTFLEALFDSLLETIGTSKAKSGIDYDEVGARVDGLNSFEARTDYFRELTNCSLMDAIGKTSYTSFYESWTRVRRARNGFVHGDPWAIKADIAAIAARLATDGVHVAARLQNTYAIRALPRSGEI